LSISEDSREVVDPSVAFRLPHDGYDAVRVEHPFIDQRRKA
jgi:hypothetical protein